MPVSQSIAGGEVSPKSRVTLIESVGSGVLGSSTRNGTESRPVVVSSVTRSEFCQLKRPEPKRSVEVESGHPAASGLLDRVQPAAWKHLHQ